MMDTKTILHTAAKNIWNFARKYMHRDFKMIFVVCVLVLTIIKHFAMPFGESSSLCVAAPVSLGLYDEAGYAPHGKVAFLAADSSLLKHSIYSVPGYKASFPDENDVQLVAAERFGISVAADRKAAEQASDSLVCVESNVYYDIDKLHTSVPYLVPRAAVLLQDIGRDFCDSLLIKQIPVHKIIVTSVLRTEEDVARLQRRNGNATTHSCHLHGTTFDICYNRYTPADEQRLTTNDTLKWILSEVLRDFRERDRCYVKYEVKQACYHITVR